ncbi:MULTISPECIES: SIR2 family protein [unclassified Sphingobacterium]|uniref:SIR2 family protein n=1 Tax=unclassified Sphingobacterium TaxID=2609468 RepID=UPI0020C40B67|nr:MULTISPECIES: SIR2 family protein [unclassified Sphingobacterium]
MNIPSQIQNAISKNKLVIFAGSGLSAKFALPSWKDLVKNVINEIDNKTFSDLIPVLESGLLKPIEVLDKIQGEHKIVRSYIQKNFNIDIQENLTLHKKILNLTGSIITTNYDNAFEQASLNSIIPAKSTSDFNISNISQSEKPYIFKIHGCYTEPDNCLIFSKDYLKIYDSDSSIKEKLKAIFIDKTIIFVGFSFNDPDINYIFSNLDNVFQNNNRHFVLTKDEHEFEKYKYLTAIPIMDYDNDIDSFFDKCLEIKNQQKNSPINKLSSEIVKKPKIALLRPEPLDIIFDPEIYSIENCLEELDIELHTGFLDARTLESIDDYDILIIITKVFKDKLYIEDDNQKSDLISSEEICYHVPNDRIPIIFITNDKIDLVPGFNTINISTYKRSVIKRFIFKGLRSKNLDFTSDEHITIGLSFLSILEFNKGNSKKSSIYSANRVLDIGEKSLKNIIGRIEEQSSIISKIQGIKRSNKVLNIKASGGTGKTTLIKKVAYEMYNRGYFKEGVSFNSCENIKSFEDFEELIIEAFNLRNIINFKEYLIENYSSRKIDSLVILDNFETVANSLQDKAYDQSIDLLKFVTDFANIVITSREKISKLDDFEDLYSLAPLSTDDALSLFERDYGKIISEEEIRILRTEILEDLLNNNPLAIKLVTKSRTRFKHIEELSVQIKEHFFESLNEDFTLVFKNKEDLNIERTKSIYQSINYSYATLNAKEKIAFELLSIFPDGISLTNFKKCFEKSNSTNNISDKELRVLRDKSLVEDYNGTLQLQPIIRRFAEYQFSKRSKETKQKYCMDAYLFNCYLLDVLRFIEKRKSTSEALKIYNHFKNNMLNVFTYIPNIPLEENGPVPGKKYLLNYIDEIQQFIVNDRQIKEFYHKIDSIQDYFSDLPYAGTLIEVIKLAKIYYFEEFENSYSELCNYYNPNELESRNNKDEDLIEENYKDIIANIHDMEGYTLSLIKAFIKNENYSHYSDSSFFYLGIPTIISRKRDGFYYFEYELMFNQLDIKSLTDYIDSLFLEQHLEIMQSTYTLSKVIELDKNAIKKLVVTNPYTRGLKDLMLASISGSEEEKNKLYKSALKNLFHIKYYYLEALYFYCIFLKNSENMEYLKYLSEGLDLSKKYFYQYQYHLFSNLNKNSHNDYIFSYDFYSDDRLETFVNKHNEVWEKRFKEKNLINA